MKHELGEIILEREFETPDADGDVGQVKLRVGKPQLKAETSGESRWRWYCPHQIIGIGRENVQAGPGLDAIDALLLSLQLAHVFLKDYARADNKKITWLGDEHLGLPGNEVSDDEEHDGYAGFEEIFNEFFRDFGKDKE